MSDTIMGKKVFFVHPSVFIQKEIAPELTEREYEVYMVKDEDKLAKVLKKNPESIVFASIDETLSAGKWETWIRSIMGSEETKNVSMGILSSSNDSTARQLYLNTLEVPCGFIPVKLEKTRVIGILLDTLKAAEAKGRRKYIRASTRDETTATVNVPHDNAYLTGTIRDISVVGFACAFSQDPELEKNSLLPDVQVKLQGSLFKAEAVVFGSRMDGDSKIYVLVFTPRIDPDIRTKIRAYIQKKLQSYMEAELK